MSDSLKGDRAVPGAITLRHATEADYDFMRRLYHSTRAEEMQHFPFDDAQKTAFLDQQFSAQFEHYGIHYPTCERNIVEKDGVLDRADARLRSLEDRAARLGVDATGLPFSSASSLLCVCRSMRMSCSRSLASA